MSLFQKAPVLVLNSKEQTIEFITRNNGFYNEDYPAFEINSPWLCDVLDELEEKGFVYNQAAQEFIEKTENIGPYPEGSTLSILVYNAQRYRVHDKVLRLGYERLTDDLVKRAIEQKKKIELYEELTIMKMAAGISNRASKGYRPICVNGKYGILSPRSKTKGYWADGRQAAKLMD